MRKDPMAKRLAKFPWWLLTMVLIALWTAYIIYSRGNYNEAFRRIIQGLGTTIVTSLAAYGVALIFGLLAGMGRISRNVVLNNLATLYVELVRGIPMLVLIFFIALVGVPTVVDGVNGLGNWLNSLGLTAIGGVMTKFTNQALSMNARAIVALAVTYGAFLAEIFRAGIQSIGRGQTEAARSLGMSTGQRFRSNGQGFLVGIAPGRARYHTSRTAACRQHVSLPRDVRHPLRSLLDDDGCALLAGSTS